MRFLFAAYCMVNDENGDSLIGVYKRCLRIGLELHRRGHQVAVVCPGHGLLQDGTVRLAIEKLTFITLPFKAYLHASSQYRRRCLRKAVRAFGADLVAIGDAPLGGFLLDAAVTAAELGIPSVILDNAYSAGLAARYVRNHGGTADGIALMGPSSFQMRNPPPYYCGVAPLIRPSGPDACAALDNVWPNGQRVVTVLGYERKAEQLALALLSALPRLRATVLLVTANIADATARLAALPHSIREKIQLMEMPAEEVLFEILRRSRLVVGKAGYMQLCECVCMQTPFLGLYYPGCCSVFALPLHTLRFVGQTSRTAATFAVKLRFLRLLHTPKRLMGALHRGGFNGLATVCDFLERTAGKLRDGVAADAARLGYTAERVRQALEARHPGRKVEVLWVRSAPFREGPDGCVDCVVARYRSGRRESVATLWGRRLTARFSAYGNPAISTATGLLRKIWYRSPDGRLQLEEDIGEDRLPGFWGNDRVRQ